MSDLNKAVDAQLETPVMQHTPGPWKFALFEHEPNEAFVQWRAGFAAVHGSRAGREANARLIAAAPDLLECLIAVEVLFTPHCKDSTQANWLEKTQALLRRLGAA